jgi:hypothetical protein
MKLLFIFLFLLCKIVYAQTESRNYGIRYIELGSNIKNVWQDYDKELRKIKGGALEFRSSCEPILGNYGNRKVFECSFIDIRLFNESKDLTFTTDNDSIIKIQYPSQLGSKLENNTSEEYINIFKENLSKKYSQEPVITSKPIKLVDNFDDEIIEYTISCKKVLKAAFPQYQYDLDGICKITLQENAASNLKFDMNQLPRLSAKRDELLYNIKLANSKKGTACKNCNGTINTAQWGETGSNNVMRISYTKRDTTGAYRFYGLDIRNDKAISELQDINRSMMKNIESNALK